MMEVVLLRHGHDAPHNDGSRPLSGLGQQQASEISERLSEMFPDGLDEAYVSPVLRAQETAQIVAEGLSIAKVITSDGLAAGAGTSEYHTRINDAEKRGVESLLLIGHLPEVVSCALEQCGHVAEEIPRMSIGQGTAIRLTVQEGTGKKASAPTVITRNGTRSLIDV